jgi:serine/threonine-protein kinase
LEGFADGDRYSAERVLGLGGMGLVELVDDRQTGRHVARKRLKDGGFDPEDRARFEREALVHAQLEHPSIVPVYDIGRSDDGALFFTMKRVEGDSLSSILTDGSYTRRRLLAAFSQVCLAAQFAHERGVIHRDIKPDNIMLGRYGEVYLLDWGIAKVTTEDDLPATKPVSGATVTEAGIILGTLATMAPEQVTGEEIGPRTDVYALGAVLFEILTKQPFHPKGEFDKVAGAIVAGVDAHASTRCPNANVPPELEVLCVSATRPEPKDRPSAKELHEAIESYLDGDRDLALRQAEAGRLIKAAKKAAESVLSGSDDSKRSDALRDVGRALAFDPSNRQALGTLVSLLTTPPKEVPEDVKAGMHASLLANLRRGGIAGVALFLTILAFSFATLLTGSMWRQIGYEQVFWTLAILASAFTIKYPSVKSLGLAFVFGIVATLLVVNNYSAIIIIPAIISIHALLFSLVRGWHRRWFFIGVAVAAWTVAFFGEHFGLFQADLRFLDRTLCISSPLMTMPKGLLTAHLYSSALIAIIVPAIVVGVVREAMNRSDERNRLFSWQLRQLIPEKDSGLQEPTTKPTPSSR